MSLLAAVLPPTQPCDTLFWTSPEGAVHEATVIHDLRWQVHVRLANGTVVVADPRNLQLPDGAGC
jgi:hypothetical protein